MKYADEHHHEKVHAQTHTRIQAHTDAHTDAHTHTHTQAQAEQVFEAFHEAKLLPVDPVHTHTHARAIHRIAHTRDMPFVSLCHGRVVTVAHPRQMCACYQRDSNNANNPNC